VNGTCPECRGTTWITTVVDGRTKCIRCRCYLNSRKERLLKSARIPDRYERCSIGNFETGGNPAFIKISDRVRRFVEFFPGDRKGLLLMGPMGVGKTHLAVGIIHYLIEDKNVACLFYDFRELLNDIRSTYNKDSQLSERAVIQPLLTCDLLVLDELGAEKTSHWVLDILMYILNYRYNRMGMTIITTNYMDEPGTLTTGFEETLADRIGIRLRSRLHEMCHTLLLEGNDYRLNKGSEAFQKGIRGRLKRRTEEK